MDSVITLSKMRIADTPELNFTKGIGPRTIAEYYKQDAFTIK